MANPPKTGDFLMSGVREQLQVKVLKTLEPLCSMSMDKLEELASKSSVEELPPGRVIFRQGERDKRIIYLLNGQLELQITGNPQAETVKAKTLEAKYPIAQEIPRPSTCRTKTNATLLYVDSDLLEILLDDNPSGTYEVTEIGIEENESDWMMRFLHSPAFLQLPTENIQTLLMQLEEIPAKKGESIIKQGEIDSYYYIIKQGRCAVSRRPAPKAEEVRLAILSPGDGFGEEALITNGKRNASVTMQDDGVLMRLDKTTFNRLLVDPLINKIDHKTLMDKVKMGATLIDVRSNKEFSENGIKGALNIPLSMLRIKSKELNSSREHILYCNSGNQSAAAAFLLTQLGLPCFILNGGIDNQQKPFSAASANTTAKSAAPTQPAAAAPAPTPSSAPIANKTSTSPAAKPEIEAAKQTAKAAVASASPNYGQSMPLSSVITSLSSEIATSDITSGIFNTHRRQAQDKAKQADEAAKKLVDAEKKTDALRSKADALRSQAERLAKKTASAQAEQLKAEAEIKRIKDEAIQQSEKMLATAKLEIAREKEKAKQNELEINKIRSEAETSRQRAQQELERIKQEAADVQKKQADLEQEFKSAEQRKQQASQAAEEARRQAKLEAERVKAEAEAIRKKAVEDAQRLKQQTVEAQQQMEKDKQAARIQAEQAARNTAAIQEAKQRAELAIQQAAQAAEEARRQAALEAEAIRREAVEEAERLRQQLEQERQQAEEKASRAKAVEKLRYQKVMEEARQNALQEARRQAEEEAERIRREALEEAERLRSEMEATRMLVESEALRAKAQMEDEAARRRNEEEQARKAMQEEYARFAEEETRRRMEAEEARLRLEEEHARFVADELARKRQLEQERLHEQQEAEARRIAEEQRIQQEAETRRLAEEQRIQQEAETRRLAEEQRIQQEAETRRLAEEQRIQQEAEARRIAEAKRLAEEQAQAERLQREAELEAQRAIEAEALRRSEELDRLAAEEAQMQITSASAYENEDDDFWTQAEEEARQATLRARQQQQAERRAEEIRTRKLAESIKARLTQQGVVSNASNELAAASPVSSGPKLAKAKLHVVNNKTILEGEEDIFIFKAPSEKPPTREEAAALIKAAEEQLKAKKELPKFVDDIDYADEDEAAKSAQVDSDSVQGFSDSVLTGLDNLSMQNHGASEEIAGDDFNLQIPNEYLEKRRTRNKKPLYALAASVVIMVTVSVITVLKPDTYLDVNGVAGMFDGKSGQGSEAQTASMRSGNLAAPGSNDKEFLEQRVKNDAELEFQSMLNQWRKSNHPNKQQNKP